MYRNKQSVDKHVANITGRIRNEREILSKGYQFAKLYYDVKEYEISKRYLAGFLTVKDNYAPAHKLMGLILEKLEETAKAVAALKCSLDIDNNQNDVLLKICELYSKTDIDPERARYWVERAEKVFTNNPVVFRLKEKMYAANDGTKNSEDLENLITSELVKRPSDAKLRAKLLRLYIDTGRINEAYTHAVDVEKRLPYADNLEWYQCLLDVYEVYERESGASINGSFHRNLLLADHALVTLTLEKALVSDAANALHRLDHDLYKAEVMKMQEKESKFVVNEVKSQFFLHAGTLVLKRAQQDHIGWKEACSYAALCFLYSHAIGMPNVREPWLQNMPPEGKLVYLDLHSQAAYRISQTGHMIKVFCSGEAEKWMSKIQKNYGSKQNLEKFYDVLFTLRHMKASKGSSFLLNCSNFTNFTPRFPDDDHLRSVDRVAYKTKPESLHPTVWLALQYFTVKDTTQPAYDFNLFESLQFNVENLDGAGSETLCQLDMMAFLYGVVYCAALAVHERLSVTGTSPVILPASIMPSTVSPVQQEWWSTAYRLYRNIAKEQLGRMRQTLQRGLECIRLVDDRGMSAQLSVHLAKTFEERANEMKAKNCSVESTALEDRAQHYWKKSLIFLERLKKNQNLPSAKYVLFPSDGQVLAQGDLDPLIAEGRYFIALCLMHSGQQEDALKQFEKVFTVEAAFYQSQIFRRLAEEESSILNDSEVPLDGESQTRQMALLERARDSLYMAMDRTKGSRSHKLIPRLSSEIDDIEARIARVQQGGRDRSVSECSEDGSVATGRMSMMGEKLHESHRLSVLAQSTPRGKPIHLDLSMGSPSDVNMSHVRPSPERLDAQMRAIAQNNDMLIKHVMRQNEKLEKEKSDMASELKESRDLIEKLKEKVDMLEKKISESTAVGASCVPGAAVNNSVAAQQQAMLAAAAASPDPRVRPPIPGIATAPHLAFYPYRPEYDFGGQAFSPHGYHMYAPHIQYGYPSPGQMQMPGIRQTAPQMVMSDEADDGENDFKDDDYDDDSAAGAGQVPDSQLIQDWPYGNSVGLEGKSTLTYSPTHRHPVAEIFNSPRPGMTQLYPGGGQGPTMPGPGYFSSPERPSMVYNTTRYSAPHFSINPGVMTATQAPPHQIPKTGLLAATTGAPPVVSTNGVPGVSGVTANLPLNQLSKVGTPIVQQPASVSAVEPPGSAAIATGQKYATNFPIVITSSISTAMSSNTDTVLSSASCARALAAAEVLDPDDDDEVEDTYQGPDFEPIIPLPDEVEVKTGEEEENVLFAYRAKLYRFIDKQWKDRGVGEIKILYREDSNQARIVMRRDQVLKVCANHYVKEDATIDFKSASDHKTATWQALDYSDDEPRLQQFCCRFKTEDLCRDFKDKFEEAREKVKTGTARVSSAKTSAGGPKTGGQGQKQAENLFDKFKPKVGSWECTGCYVVNTGETTVCPACQTPKPGTKPPAKPAFAPSAGGGFKMAIGSSSNSGFGTPSATTAPVFGVPAASTAPGFGSPAATTATGFSVPAATTAPGFGVPATTTAPGFGVPPATAALGFGTQATTASPGFSAPATAAPGFGTRGMTAAPGFGAPATTTAPGFGAPATTGAPLFGAPATTAAPGFGAPATTTAPGFGAPATTTAPTVGTSSGFKFGPSAPAPPATTLSGFGQNVATTTAAPSVTTTSKPGFTFSTTTTGSGSGFAFGKPVSTVASTPSATSTSTVSSTVSSSSSKQSFTFSLSSSSSSTGTASGSESTGKESQTSKPSPFAGPLSFTFGNASAGAAKPFSFTSSTSSTPASDLLKNIASGQDPSSKTFGGFTFTSTPVVSEIEDSQKSVSSTSTGSAVSTTDKDTVTTTTKTQPPKTNVFASFSFSPPKASSANSSKVTSTTANTSPAPAPVIGGSSNMASFSEVANAGGSTNAFGTPGDFKAFGGAGQQLFQAADGSPKVGETGGVETEGPEDEYEPDVDFKPVVPLPDLVEVKTGEEDEEKLFSQRARLFRHDSANSQWKERGIGDLKILRHQESKRCRILMRRDQVLKLCANHFITKDMKLSPLMSSDRAWCWFAQDFSEGEVSNDHLAVRFKTAEIAQQFMKVFEECQNDTEKVVPVSRPEPVVKCTGQQTLVDLLKSDTEKKESAASKPGKAPEKKGFGDLFKPKTGDWECNGCYVQNKSDVIRCPACNTLKPGATEPEKEASSTVKFGAGAGGGFTIQGSQSSGSFGFGSSSSSNTSSSGFGGFNFGPTNSEPSISSTTVDPATSSASGFAFGSTTSSSGFNFSLTPGFGTTTTTDKTAAPTITSTSTPVSTPAASGTSPLKYVFGQENTSFSFTPVKPQPRTRQDSHRSRHDSVTKSPGAEDEYYESEGDDSHIYFEPLVHLEKVEVKTGEEEEHTLYCHRAKLYRFTKGEWKERGLGDIKLLKHKETNKVRLLMRREKILKLCLNQSLTPDLELKEMANSEGKSYIWHNMDCSDGEPSHEQFAIRFKSKEIASDFAKAFNDAKSGDMSTPVKSKQKDSKNSKDNDGTKSEEKKEFSFTSESPSTAKTVSGFKFTPPKLSTPASTSSDSGAKNSFSGFAFGSNSKNSPSVFGGSAQSTPGSANSSPLSKGRSLLASLLEDPKGNDVEITGEDKPSEALQQKARDLQLPETFYNYEKKEPCPGCTGCDSEDHDVQIVKVEEASEEQIVKAQQLQLPRHFYLYENADPCPGCIGCRDEDEDVFALIGKAKSVEKPQSQPVSAEKVPEKKMAEAETSSTEQSGMGMFAQAAANSFSFADIAAKTSPAFQKDSSKPFSWRGSGAQVFGQVPTVVSEDGEEGEVAPSQDIHFEPLVQLPEVEVKTGEEDEEVLYSHRAKLFRYTDQQWKERGVGDIKLLRHNQTGKIRILMRRDQIHKLCCNHNLSPDLELRPLATSETAWCWNTMDYTDAQGSFEQFALRFKTKDIAEKFKEKFEECRELAKLASVPTMAEDSFTEEAQDQSSRVEDVDTTREEQDESVEQYEGEYDDEEYEDEEPLFQKRATVEYLDGPEPVTIGMGELRIVLDEDVNGARICFEKDDGTILVNHIICMEHQLQCNEKKKFCEWTAKDFSTDEPVRRTFRVTFSSKNTVTEFRNCYQEGKDLAIDSAIGEL